MRSLFALITLALLSGCPAVVPAFGHEWFSDHRYLAPDGTHCCNARADGTGDCKPYPADHVTVTPRGYRLHDGVEVPFRQAYQSQDHQFWRCDWGGRFKCFFAVVGGS